ncbi:RNA polymerase factor sigma-54 [uncultured Roseobacter sp.]|uniref:RNA polymerase factor sigma-54 n=1 Tax=uncultured Roseobacter sp. TaxID=114847 RepID=UPI0026398AA1|nr:RNA polymerase factor sigma-54 [uncultured Roseobacter sp.]
MNFSQTRHQSQRLNKTMIETLAIMRMNRVEMHKFLSDAAEKNPFIELESHKDSTPGQASYDVDAMSTDLADVSERGIFQHVVKQLPYVCTSPGDLEIARAFLLELDLSGWLSVSVEEIAEKYALNAPDCAEMLVRLQTLEPAGLFARNLRECISLQALDRGQLDDIMRRIIVHLDELRCFDPEHLAKRIGCNTSDILERVRLIRRMDPKPGAQFDFQEAPRKTDDVTVAVVDGKLTVTLNNFSFPSVRALHLDTTNHRSGPNTERLRHLVQEARSLKKACELRNATTLSLVTAIFIRQPDFLKAGFAALRPMRMRDLASEIGVSESTVSRILHGLTILCSQGNVPARALFCNALTYGNETQTKHAALQKIRQWVAAEDQQTPLKDEEILARFQKLGFSISRRTISKYRNELGLVSPRLRRKAAKKAPRNARL